MLGRDRGAALGGTDAVRHRGGREAGECDDLVGPGALKRDSSQFLQSMMLGLGAWLAIRVEVTPRIIIAASILLGRALASIDQAVGQWPLLQRALEGRRSPPQKGYFSVFGGALLGRRSQTRELAMTTAVSAFSAIRRGSRKPGK